MIFFVAWCCQVARWLVAKHHQRQRAHKRKPTCNTGRCLLLRICEAGARKSGSTEKFAVFSAHKRVFIERVVAVPWRPRQQRRRPPLDRVAWCGGSNGRAWRQKPTCKIAVLGKRSSQELPAQSADCSYRWCQPQRCLALRRGCQATKTNRKPNQQQRTANFERCLAAHRQVVIVH